MLFINTVCRNSFLKRAAPQFHYHRHKQEILLSGDTGSDCIEMSQNPKLYGFFKDPCCLYAPKLSWPVFPTVWNAGGKPAKSVSNVSQCQPP